MFKLFTLGVVSLLGMNYSNNVHNNVPILYANDTPVVRGGIDAVNHYYTGFLTIDSSFKYGPISVDYAPYSVDSYYYTMIVRLSCDRFLIKYYDDVYDSKDYFDGDIVIQNLIHYDFSTTDLVISFNDLDLSMNFIHNSSTDDSGLQVFVDSVANGDVVLYFDNLHVANYQSLVFQLNGQNYIVNRPSVIGTNLIPYKIDDNSLYEWLDYDYEFGSDIFALGYFNYDNSAYYALGYAIQSQTSRADNVSIFKGLFKSFDNYYDSYDIQYMQNIDGNQYFGPLGVSSLSDCIHLTNSDYFYPFAGRYHNIGYDDSHGYDYVWYTLYTQIGTSGTVNTAISNVRSFQHPNFSKLHIYYQNKTLVNQTRVYAKTYYDLLTYNPNYNVLPGGGSTGNGLQGAFDLLGTAFNKLWQVGNIAVLGSITLNTLILLPLVISLMLFVIHLIKKG